MLEDRLKERRACSHAKCDICCRGDKQLAQLEGRNREEDVQERTFIRKMMDEHGTKMLRARAELDQAGYQAIVQPRQMWTLIVDAATKSNMELPRLKGRRPKCMTLLIESFV